MDVLDQLAVALGFATLAGLNLYLTVLVTGMAIQFQWIELLPRYESLAVLGEPAILAVAAVLFLLEFFADKIPWVDSLWDVFHTLVRPIGGGLLALQALGNTTPAFDVVIALVAGIATMVTHGLKAGTRLVINASPEPISNITASVVEDTAVVGASILMWTSPKIALVVFIAFLAIAIYATPRVYRAIHANLHLLLEKLRVPATNKSAAARHLPRRLTATEDIVLSAELSGRDPEVAWAAPVLTGRGRGIRGLVPNLFGKLVIEKSRPGAAFFIGQKNWNAFLREIPLADCRFSYEPRFFSEDLVINDKSGNLRVILRFSRSEGALVERVIKELEVHRSAGAAAAPSIGSTPAGSGNQALEVSQAEMPAEPSAASPPDFEEPATDAGAEETSAPVISKSTE